MILLYNRLFFFTISILITFFYYSLISIKKIIYKLGSLLNYVFVYTTIPYLLLLPILIVVLKSIHFPHRPLKLQSPYLIIILIRVLVYSLTDFSLFWVSKSLPSLRRYKNLLNSKRFISNIM